MLLWLSLASTIILQNVVVETPAGRQPGMTIVIEGSTIRSIDANGVSARPNDRVIDGKGRIVTAGIVAADSQLGLMEVSLEKASRDAGMNGAAQPAFNTADGYEARSPHVGAEREEGVTTAILAPSAGPLLSGVGHVVELDGLLRRDALNGPNHDQPCLMRMSLGQRSVQEAGGARGALWLRLSEIFEEARRYQKDPAPFEKAGVEPNTLSPIHLRALGPVLRGQLPLLVDVDRATDILALLHFAKTQNIRVMVRGGAESWLVATELKAAQVPVWLQLSSSIHPASFDALQTRDDVATRLQQAGVELVLTSWGTDNGTSRARYEAGFAVARGLPRGVAIAAITETPLRLCGRNDKDVGLKAGARANLVMWSNDPFETTTRALHVFIAGVEQTEKSRQRELTDRYLTPSKP
jgi:imidazolonepropionase-like amidohydrolase